MWKRRVWSINCRMYFCFGWVFWEVGREKFSFEQFSFWSSCNSLALTFFSISNLAYLLQNLQFKMSQSRVFLVIFPVIIEIISNNVKKKDLINKLSNLWMYSILCRRVDLAWHLHVIQIWTGALLTGGYSPTFSETN